MVLFHPSHMEKKVKKKCEKQSKFDLKKHVKSSEKTGKISPSMEVEIWIEKILYI